MNMKKVVFFLFMVIGFSCKTDKKWREPNITKVQSSESVTDIDNDYPNPSFEKQWANVLELDNSTILWMAKDSYYPFLKFFNCSNSNFVYIQFDGNKSNDYPITVKKDKIIINYANFIDPTMSFPKTKSIPPKLGEPFVILTLLNDTTFQANYLNTNWIKEINEITIKNSHPYFSVTYIKKDISK
jgi:hypothetical protein